MTETSSSPSRAGQIAKKVYPGVDRWYWEYERRRTVRSMRSALSTEAARLNPRRADGKPRLVVVPDIGQFADSWHVGGGNLLFEVWQSAIEVLGHDAVTLFPTGRDEDVVSWQQRLLRMIGDVDATHVIIQAEADPNNLSSWNWDIVVSSLADRWGGTLVGLTYDSVHTWLTTRLRRLGAISSSFMVADLCVPAEGLVKRGRFEVGPMTMPFSAASVAAVDATVAGVQKTYEVSFIGALYDYRVELLKHLRSLGFAVAVNPHRPDATTDFEESRRQRPTYLDYMRGLAQSEITVNFSLASGGPAEQYKIRVHEAALVGCLVATDDRLRTREFFAPDQFAYFPTLDSLESVVTRRLADRDRLRESQEGARLRAHELSATDFWGRIDDGLRRRGLPVLTGLRPPRAPSTDR